MEHHQHRSWRSEISADCGSIGMVVVRVSIHGRNFLKLNAGGRNWITHETTGRCLRMYHATREAIGIYSSL
jgi:hypothetical protein